MLAGEKDRQFREDVEKRLEKLDILDHGLPLGIGHFHISTSSWQLQVFLEGLNLSLKEKEAGRPMDEQNFQRLQQKLLNNMQGVDEEEKSEWELVNHWTTKTRWRGKLRREVAIWRHKETGAYKHTIQPFGETSSRMQLLVTSCMIRAKCSVVETEHVARESLLSQLSDVQKDQYLLTDSFIEVGASGVHYILRRNRPTLALRIDPEKEPGAGSTADVLCALCMHPLAYYTGSWIGVMPPSDEILAHLLHIRADEHRYWRVCNQHNPAHYLSGL